MEINADGEGNLEPENDFFCTSRTIHMNGRHKAQWL